MKKCIIISVLISLYGCSNQTKNYEQLNVLLEQVFIDDQNFRQEANSIPDSSQRFVELWDTIPVIDLKNLTIIKEFFIENSYPDTINYTWKARTAPYNVLQHALDVDERLRYYKYLENGYKNGALSAGQLWQYLSRTYNFKFKEHHPINNTFENSYEQRISVLKKSLNLN